jgi:hypothetical protein
MAVGTHGQGDQCAPSHLFNSVIQYGGGLDVMVQYEIAAVYAAVAQGIAVVVTDVASHNLGASSPDRPERCHRAV